MPKHVDPGDPSDDVEVYTVEEVNAKLAALEGRLTKAYQKPDGGIPRDHLAADVQASLAKVDSPPTVAPPTTNPPTTPPYVSKATDFDWLHWDPGNNGSPIPENSSFHTITAPSGPGFEFVCTDANQTAWNPHSRAVLTQKMNTCALGQTHDWTWDMFLPTQVFNVTPYCLWEFHTGGVSSGHLLDVTTSNYYRLVRQTGPLQDDYVQTIGPSIVFDVWTPIRIQVRWSRGSDGFLRMWIDNAECMNYSGQTWFNTTGAPYVQFGYYGVHGGGLTNTVKFANIQRVVT